MGSGPLDGLLVVAVEQAVAAPICTLRLADAGARVIKVERPEGDTARHYDRVVDGTSAYFAWLNRGKESAVLDLKDPDDLALVRRMAARADIFIQNLAPGAAAKLGLGAPQLVACHPRVIAVDIVGYGQDTAYAPMRAYDMLIQAESGLAAVTGGPDAPARVGVSVADIATGISAYTAILEALLARDRSGSTAGGRAGGRALEIAMFDAVADWMTVPLLHYDHAGTETARCGLAHAAIAPYRAYDCRDGAVLISIQQPLEWARFCSGVLERPELAGDPRFADNPARVRNRTALDAEIEPVFAGLTCARAIERLEAHRIAWGRVSGLAELSAHPALRRIPVGLPGGGMTTLPRPAGFRPGDTPEIETIPALGQDTDRIRAEFAAAPTRSRFRS